VKKAAPKEKDITIHQTTVRDSNTGNDTETEAFNGG